MMRRLLAGALFFSAACSSSAPTPSEPTDLTPLLQTMRTQVPGGSIEMQGNTIHTRDENGKLVAITHLKRTNGVVTSVETTILGPKGEKLLKSEHKAKKGDGLSFFDKACDLFMPQKLHAAAPVMMEDLPCLVELAAMAGANLALAASVAGLVSAVTACGGGVAPVCATIPVLQAALASAIITQGITIAQFTLAV